MMMALFSSSTASASAWRRIDAFPDGGDRGLPFLLLLLQPLLLLALGIVVTFVALPWIMALATVLRDHCWRGGSIRTTGRRHEQARSRDEPGGSTGTTTTRMTLSDALSVLTVYKGRVWHTRFRPARHSFTYPVFFFEVDLTGLHDRMLQHQQQQQQQGDSRVLAYSQEDCDRALRDALWPLSTIVHFSSKDHLKNGEGGTVGGDGGDDSSTSPSLLERVQNLLRDEERGRRRRKKKKGPPSPSTEVDGKDTGHGGDAWDLVGNGAEYDSDDDVNGDSRGPSRRRYRTVLVTNLSYYGYCFNPVSYYLVLDDRHQQQRSQQQPQQQLQPLATTIAAVVGEVSNTPWGEMHCYVLLPTEEEEGQGGADVEGTAEADDDNHILGGGRRPRRFVFPKTFHVSPFMEMNYDYDWSFRYMTNQDGTTAMDIHNSLLVVDDKEEEASDTAAPTRTKAPRQRQFHARLLVQSSTPTKRPTSIWSIAYQLSCYPVYGLMVQLWIHYQALLLFVVRRVPFQPHPHGSETLASRTIGAIMTPLFAVQALCDEWVRTPPPKGDPSARGTSSPPGGAETKKRC